MSHVSHIFFALSDETRLEIIEKLMRYDEMPAGDISDMFDISGPAISRHLSVLLKAGLVKRRVAGKQRLYSACPGAIRRVSDWTMDHRSFWESSLDRIETALREES